MNNELYSTFTDQSRTGRYTFFEPLEMKHLDYSHSLYQGYLKSGGQTPALLIMNSLSAYRFVHELSDDMKERIELFDLRDRTRITPVNLLSSNIGSLGERQNYLETAINTALTDKSELYRKLPLTVAQIEALRCAIAAICYINDRSKTKHNVGPSLLQYLLIMNKEHSENFAENFLNQPDESAIYRYFKDKFHSTSLSQTNRQSIFDLIDNAINCFGNSDILPLINSPYQAFSPRKAIEEGKIVIVIPDYTRLFDKIFCQWMVSATCDYLRLLTDPFLFVCEGFENFYEYDWSLLMASRDMIRTAITFYDLRSYTANENAAFMRAANHIASILFKPERFDTPWIRNYIPVHERRLGTDVEVFFHDWWFNEITDPGIYLQDWERLPEGKRIPYENVPGYTWSLLDTALPVNATSFESRILSAQKEVIERSQKPPLNKKAGRMLKSFFTDK